MKLSIYKSATISEKIEKNENSKIYKNQFFSKSMTRTAKWFSPIERKLKTISGNT